ncbi:MAG: antibiotic biosynthesis monooxygenase [Chloroflexi bacterium]|nr:antibiotic biosynthesis monooxygenase [Chloroflexota bacterium]
MNEIRILVQFAAEDLATADQHVAQLHNTCNRVANTPGCLQFEVFRSAIKPRRCALIEHWASEAALEAFHVTRGARPEPPAGVTLVREHYPYQTWEA